MLTQLRDSISCSIAVLVAFIPIMAFEGAAQEYISPPVAAVLPKADTLHGDVRIDDYFWLRERSHPEVIDYLQAENDYTEAVMQHTEPLQEKLFQELKGRIEETDLSVPEKIDDFFYYTRTKEGKEYPIYCRKKGSMEAPEELLLDQNALAEGVSYCQMGAFRVSPDHRLLAYSLDTTGAEIYTVRVKDLQTGALLEDRISRAYDELEWANDNRTLFYSTMDQTLRPYRLYRHTLGSSQDEDVLVFEEPDEMFYLKLSKTRSERFLLIHLESKMTSEVHYLDAQHPTGSFQVIQPRQHGVEYFVTHHGDAFYVLSNDEAENFQLLRTPLSNPSRDHWQVVIAHRPDVKIDAVDLFENHLVVSQRQGGLKRIEVHDLRDGHIHQVDFPEPVYTFWLEKNPEFHTDLLRFNYSSLVTPRTIYDVHLDHGTWELKKTYQVLGGYDPSQYRSERIWAMAADSTQIPISLVFRREISRDGSNPLYLHGYGSYGSSTEPRFSSHRLSLLDRGFIYAIAHIRGGGEMGRRWYQEGKLLHKMNTFSDFIACAEHLVAEQYTSKEHLVISGSSAGGLLIGAVTNLRPDLFSVVVADVPFVDVINTMLDPTIPLTVTEYEEWGDPSDPQYYQYMKRYSPYDNVQPKAYPNMLITAGLNDPRVQYWEPAKWTAKLRALKTDDHVLLLKTNMGAGHFGHSGRYDGLREVAFEYAFILDMLGMEE